jgi:hypothetical protein
VKRGVSFSEYAVLVAGVLVIVSIALAGLGVAYEEISNSLQDSLDRAFKWILEGEFHRSGTDGS